MGRNRHDRYSFFGEAYQKREHREGLPNSSFEAEWDNEADSRRPAATCINVKAAP